MMTAEQLKNSILQLALSGKLVPQRKEDEPAQALLKRIRIKKNTLINARIIPKDKRMDEVADEEQLFDIPENWIWTRIGELFQHNTGKALNGTNKEGTVLPYITTSNLYWNRFELDNLKEMPFTESEIEKCTAKKGDLLVCEGGDYGRAAIWNFDYDIRIQNHVHKLRTYEKLCIEYFYYVFYYLKTTGQIKGKGIAIQGLSSGVLHNLVVPLPPLAEQKRIVAKIEELMPFVEQYAAASTKLNTLNTSFPEMMKKSILQEAVQGKLVPQDPNDEPASVLLKKIAEEKKRLVKEGKIKKQKPLPEITEDEIPFEIPESWEWARWGTISESIQYGYNAPAKSHGRIKMVRISDIQNNDVAWTTVPYCDIEESEIADYLLKENDILFARTGGTVGKSFLVKTISEEAIYAGYLIRTRYSHNLCPQFLKFFMESELYWKQLRNGTIATAQPNCNGQTLSKMLIPIPPLQEQYRIAEKLKSVFDYTRYLQQ